MRERHTQRERERDLDGRDERCKATLDLCSGHSTRWVDAGNDCSVQVEQS